MATLQRFTGSHNLWNTIAPEIDLDDQNDEDAEESSTIGRNPKQDQRVSDTSDLGSETLAMNYESNNRNTLLHQGPRDRVPSSTESYATLSQSGVYRNVGRPTSGQQSSRPSYVDDEQNQNERVNVVNSRSNLYRNPDNASSQYSVRDRENSFLAKHYTPPVAKSFSPSGAAMSTSISDFPPDPFQTLRRPNERLADQGMSSGLPPQKKQVDPSPNSLLRDRQFQQVFAVKIRKRNNSFGFHVVGGIDNPKPSNGDPSIVVSDVIPRGAAVGVLRVHDVVLRVNDSSMRRVTQADYHNYLSFVMDEAVFEIGRPAPSTATLDNRMGGNVNLSTVVAQQTNNLPSQIKRITLTKLHQDEDFGVRVGVRYFIRYIPKNSSASRGAQLKPNDVLLKVNGRNVNDIPTLKDVQTLINNHNDELELVVESFSGGDVTGLNNQDVIAASIPSPTLTSAPNSLTSQTDSGMASMTTDERDALGLLSTAPSRPPLPSTSSSKPTQPASLNISLNYSTMSTTTPESITGGSTGGGGGVNIAQLKTTTEDDGGFRHFNAVKAAQLRNSNESRVVQFDGTRNLGLKLAGGNVTGVFILAVQDGSQAKRLGLAAGDEIVQVVEQKTTDLTREQVLRALQATKSEFDVVVRRNQEGFRQFNNRNTTGDSFYIRVHFVYNVGREGFLSFGIYDVLHVTDTLPGGRGNEGCYHASRVNESSLKDMESGLIPNQARAAEMRVKQEEGGLRGRSSSRGSSLASRSSRKFRSLSRGRGNGEISPQLKEGQSTAALPVYERVRLKSASFLRPIVIFGPIADLARSELINDSSQKYQLPQPDDFAAISSSNSGSTVNLESIKKVMEQNCHCLLDISPQNVQWLNMVGLYPIVIFFKPDSKNHVKTVRASFKTSKGGQKLNKELYALATEIEKHYSHIISEKIHLSANDIWYAKLTDTIKKHQAAQIWQSETPNVDLAEMSDKPITVGQWATTKSNASLNNTVDGTTSANFTSDSVRGSTISRGQRGLTNGSQMATPTSTLNRSRAPSVLQQQRSRSASGVLEDQQGPYESFDHNANNNFDRNDIASLSSAAGFRDSTMRSNGRMTPVNSNMNAGSFGVRSQTYDADLNRQTAERESIISGQSRNSARPQNLMSMPPKNDRDNNSFTAPAGGYEQRVNDTTGGAEMNPRASMQSRQSSQYDVLRQSKMDMEPPRQYSSQNYPNELQSTDTLPPPHPSLFTSEISPREEQTYRTNTDNIRPQWQRPVSQPANQNNTINHNDVQTLFQDQARHDLKSRPDWQSLRNARGLSGEFASDSPDVPPPHPPPPSSYTFNSAAPQHMIVPSNTSSNPPSWQRGSQQNNNFNYPSRFANDPQYYDDEPRAPLMQSRFSNSQSNVQKTPVSSSKTGLNYFGQMRSNAPTMNL